MRHIPNVLSVIRILLVGVFAWLFFEQRYIDAMIVYVAAFFTDVLDGYLARRFNWITPTGKLLDPLADKLMQIAALICIFLAKYEQTVYFVIFILCFAKELLMLLGGLFMLKRKVVVYSDWFGKTATGIFAIGIVMTFISFIVPAVEPWNIVVLVIATVLSYIAMLHYLCTQMIRRKAK